MAFRFKEGDAVKVLEIVSLGHHIRTPQFLRSKNGVVRHIRGSFKDPESLAFGKDGLPKVNLYAVEFDLPHVWNDRPPPKGVNKISADIFERWLEPR